MSSSSAIISATNVFENGNYATTLQMVDPAVTCNTNCSSLSGAVPPPKPLLIASPSEAGEFPVLIFLHGYLLLNSFYSQLILHVASHGFIVIAPQASLLNVYMHVQFIHSWVLILIIHIIGVNSANC